MIKNTHINIEKFRKKYIDNLSLEIKSAEIAQKRDEDTLIAIKNFNVSKDIYEKQRSNILLKIQERKIKIQSLKDKLEKYTSGDLDSEIKDDLERNKQKQKTNIIKCDELNKKPLKQSLKFSKNNYVQSDQSLNKTISNYYNYFRKAVDTLPNYIQYNLSQMPDNKGYIWRGCWFFGHKKTEYGQPLIMFEKVRGILNIHEITECTHKIFQKNSYGEKKLIKSIPRKILMSKNLSFLV